MRLIVRQHQTTVCGNRITVLAVIDVENYERSGALPAPFLSWETEQAPINYLILSRGVTFVGRRNSVYVWCSPDRPCTSKQEVSVYPKVTLLVSTGLLSCLWGLKIEYKHYSSPITCTWLFIRMPSFPDEITKPKYLVRTCMYMWINFPAKSQSVTWKTVLASLTTYKGTWIERSSLVLDSLLRYNSRQLPAPTSSSAGSEIPFLFCSGISYLG